MILTVLKLHSPKGSCNFENFQNHSYLLITNCTRSRAISYTNTSIGFVTSVEQQLKQAYLRSNKEDNFFFFYLKPDNSICTISFHGIKLQISIKVFCVQSWQWQAIPITSLKTRKKERKKEKEKNSGRYSTRPARSSIEISYKDRFFGLNTVRFRSRQSLDMKSGYLTSIFSNYWMRLSRIWRILQVEEGVIGRGG